VDKSELNKLNIPYNSLKLIKEIGSGGFGKVYRGKWNHTTVAIKLCSSPADIEALQIEAQLMINLRPHPNVVQILGVSFDGPYIALVLEFCEGGSLDTYLFDTANEIPTKQQIRLAYEIAQGLFHIHMGHIVHRDLASRNILLSIEKHAKISDFGLSRMLDNNVGKTKSNIGPIKWMAPEAFKRIYSEKSDVWSYGVVLSEIVNRHEPHDNLELFEATQKIGVEHKAPTIDNMPKCPGILLKIMKSCWKVVPEERPTFSKICKLFEEYYE